MKTVAELRWRQIRTSRSSQWRFLERHGITLKKPSRIAHSYGLLAPRRTGCAPRHWAELAVLGSVQTLRDGSVCALVTSGVLEERSPPHRGGRLPTNWALSPLPVARNDGRGNAS